MLNDLHVEQSEEAAAEAEAQGVARLRLEFETWIVDVKLRERVAQLLEVLPIRRIETAINHALRWPIAGQGFGRLVAGGRHRVANVNVADRLDIADQITDLPGLKLAARASLRNELAAFEQLERAARLEEPDLLSLFERAVHYPHVRDRPAVFVVMRVEHHGLQRRLGVARRRRNSLDDRFEQLIDAGACLSATGEHVNRINR